MKKGRRGKGNSLITGQFINYPYLNYKTMIGKVYL